jgi:hypothetical protein
MYPAIAFVLLQSVMLTAATAAAAVEACDDPPIAITDVRVFDGQSVVPQATVIIQCTTISRIANGSASLNLPGDSVSIDGRGPVSSRLTCHP